RPITPNTTPIEGFTPSTGFPAMEIDYFQTVGPRFFETMGIRLVEGRYFDTRDSADAPPVTIINEALARIVWPNQSALGRRMKPFGGTNWFTIIGVVGNVKNGGIDKPTDTEAYFAAPQAPNALRAGYLVVRTRTNPSALAGPAREAIRSLDAS